MRKFPMLNLNTFNPSLLDCFNSFEKLRLDIEYE